MPCWEVRTVTVEFKAKHKDLILKAAEAEGLRTAVDPYDPNIVSIDWGYLVLNFKTQTAEVKGGDYELMNRMKRAYSKMVIEEVARKRKWAIKRMGDNKLRARRY